MSLLLFKKTAPAAPPFSPVQAGDLAVWNDGYTLTYTDGTAIPQWADSGPYGNATSAAGGPLMAHVNGQPAAQLNGTTAYFNLAFGSDRIQPTTIFLVLNEDPTNTTHFFDSTNGSKRNIIGASSGNYQMYAGTILGSAVARTFGQNIVLECLFSGINSLMLLNGTTIISGDAGSEPAGAPTLQIGYSFGAFFKGYILSFLLYTGDIGSTARSQVRHYLGTRFSITVT
jgi:hypothetical protein